MGLTHDDIRHVFKKNIVLSEHYEVIKRLGKGYFLICNLLGSFGEVMKVRHKATNTMRALKSIEKKNI